MVALLILAFKVSGLSTSMGKDGYYLTANFDTIGSLKVRAPITIAGVKVGQVTNIQLDNKTFKAIVTMQIDRAHELPTDSSASIFTQGLLGANYISLSPGYEETNLKNGERIENTHPAM